MFPILAIILLLACCPAAAQPIYKCTVGGKVVYADRPCDNGDSAELAVAPAPSPDPAAAAALGRQKALLASMQKQRQARDAAQAKAAARAAKAQAGEARRCAKLRLQQRWLDEDLARALSDNRESLRRKAGRHRQAMALECPA